MFEKEHFQQAFRELSVLSKGRFQAKAMRYGDRETVENAKEFVKSGDCVANDNDI